MVPVCALQREMPALYRSPALLHMLPLLVVPICAKRIHRHYRGQPALINWYSKGESHCTYEYAYPLSKQRPTDLGRVHGFVYCRNLTMLRVSPQPLPTAWCYLTVALMAYRGSYPGRVRSIAQSRGSGSVGSGRVGSGRVGSGRVGSGRVGSVGGQNLTRHVGSGQEIFKYHGSSRVGSP